jgi:alpha-L-rhamnosidase
MRVRVEHLDVALGIGDATPRPSWQLPEGAAVQHAYELRAGAVTTGRVESADNVLVPWPWAPLTSRERREVQVRVWTDLGEAPWSEPTAVEAGLLHPGDWTATWVSPVEHGSAAPGFRPAYLLRGLAVLVVRPEPGDPEGLSAPSATVLRRHCVGAGRTG